VSADEFLGRPRRPIVPAPPLPVEGWTTVDLPVEELWRTFEDVRGWGDWNTCFRWSAMVGGRLKLGGTLVFVFNPIERRYPYLMPAWATIVALEPRAYVTWEVEMPGFHALHSYRFERLEGGRCRFGSWEVAEGRLYRVARSFWLAHFAYVCESSLRGARGLTQPGG
jgi:hypothetical protein